MLNTFVFLFDRKEERKMLVCLVFSNLIHATWCNYFPGFIGHVYQINVQIHKQDQTVWQVD